MKKTVIIWLFVMIFLTVCALTACNSLEGILGSLGGGGNTNDTPSDDEQNSDSDVNDDNNEDKTPTEPDDPEEPDTPSNPDIDEPIIHTCSFGDWIIIPSTCITKGSKTRSCECGEVETEELEIDPAAHKYEDTYSYNNTYHFYVCEYCDVPQENIAHTIVDGACSYCDYIVLEYIEGLVFTLDEETDTYSVTNYTGTSTKVIIPYIYEGKLVTSIDDYAFDYCHNLTTVTFEENSQLTSIGAFAFRYCDNLTTVTFEENSQLTSIGYRAFEYCDNLTTVNYLGTLEQWLNISFNWGSYPCFNGVQLYIDGTLLTELVIPDTITEIKDYAFNGCTSITSVTIPASVTSIGEGAFCACSNLTTVTFEENSQLTSIGYSAFYGCSKLNSITIPASVTSIGEDAFYNCDNLTSITIPASVTSIGYRAFYDCSNLTTVTFEENSQLTSIGDWAFRDCYKLNSITIPASVTSIGDYAFYRCTNLTSITIPAGVTSIGDYAFYGCYKLVEVYNLSSLDITIGSSGYGYVGCYALDIYTSLDTPSKLSTDENGYMIYTNGEDKILVGYTGTGKELTLPGGITQIYKYAFYDNNNITSVTIPTSVTSIGYEAFYKCSKLNSITIPAGVTSIDSYAFEGCYNLVEVYNLSSLNITAGSTGYGYVGCYALDIYTSLDTPSKLSTDENGYIIYPDGVDKILVGYTGTDTELTLPGGIAEINKYAFCDNDNITSVTIPTSVTSIGNYAFNDCDNLTSITIPAGVTNIGYYTFSGCSNLTTVTFEENSQLTSIGEDAFYYCSNLTIVTFEENSQLTSIGSNAFAYCSKLNSITIPASVTSIGVGAFEYCNNLITVNYLGTLEQWLNISFGYYGANPCFNGAQLYIDGTLLTEVVIPDTITEIKDYAFYGCTSITSVTIPASVTSIGSCAFYDCYKLTSITIPASVTSIGSSAFYGCYELVEVYNLSSLDITVGSSGYGYVGYYAKNVYTATEGYSKLSTDENGYIIYPDGEDKILVGYTGTGKELTLPSGITEIYKYAFYDNDNITSVTIPTSVTSIGYDAFYKCSNLTTVTFEENSQLTSIGYEAFYGCDNLTSITIPASVTSIGYYAFEYCYKLVEVYNLSSLNITKGSTSYGYVGDYALDVYTSLDTPSKLSTDENGYIIYTDGEDKILVGYTGTDTELTLPDGIIEINKYAFYKNDNITSITIPASVTSIGDYVFYGCSKLISITIPASSVTSIGSYAFAYCGNLTDIYYTGTEEQWNAISKVADWDYGAAWDYTIHYNYVEE